MYESLEALYKRLTLTKQEEDTILVDAHKVDSMIQKTERCLVLWLFIEKTYNREAFWHIMRRVWKLVQAIKFWEMGGQVTLVEFSNTHYKDKIIRKEPWSFDKHQ